MGEIVTRRRESQGRKLRDSTGRNIQAPIDMLLFLHQRFLEFLHDEDPNTDAEIRKAISRKRKIELSLKLPHFT